VTFLLTTEARIRADVETKRRHAEVAIVVTEADEEVTPLLVAGDVTGIAADELVSATELAGLFDVRTRTVEMSLSQKGNLRSMYPRGGCNQYRSDHWRHRSNRTESSTQT
jgi:hypothetical protein